VARPGRMHCGAVHAPTRTRVRRTRWTIFVVDELMSELIRSDKSLRAIMSERGYSNSDYVSFIQWLGRRPERTARYQAARRAKVWRMRSQLSGLGDEELVFRGKHWLRKQMHRIESMRPLAVRRAEAKQHRAARAARDPNGERLLQARQRAKRATRREADDET
jgi:hypothetical protein